MVGPHVSLRRTLPVLLLLCVVAWSLPRGTAESARSGSTIAWPQTIDSWSGAPVPIDERTFEILETRDVSVEEYRHPKEPPVAVAFVGGLNNRSAFHPPELCFIGSHFELVAKSTRVIPLSQDGRTVEVVRSVFRRGQGELLVYHFFLAGSKPTASYLRQQLWLVRDEVLGHGSRGALVRLSTPCRSNEISAADSRLETFSKALGELLLQESKEAI